MRLQQGEALVAGTSNHSLIPLVRKLASISTLSLEEQQAIQSLPVTIRVLESRQNIVREGDRPSRCCLLLEGWAARYKFVNEGKRQIIAFHVAGDLLDVQNLHLHLSDHSISTLTQATVAFIPFGALHGLLAKFPNLTATLWRDSLVDAAIFREWVVNVGRRSAFERLSHLFCEMYVKQAAVGLAQDHCCPLPATQVDLADATGLTSVHVNRTLRAMRDKGLITLADGTLTINSWPDLKAAAGFDPTYLHVEARAAA